MGRGVVGVAACVHVRVGGRGADLRWGWREVYGSACCVAGRAR